jgi:hypothetical protein
MADELRPKQRHVLLRQEEINQALVNHLLLAQGIDPALHETTHQIVYRIVDGSLFASVVIERVTPARKESP